MCVSLSVTGPSETCFFQSFKTENIAYTTPTPHTVYTTPLCRDMILSVFHTSIPTQRSASAQPASVIHIQQLSRSRLVYMCMFVYGGVRWCMEVCVCGVWLCMVDSCTGCTGTIKHEAATFSPCYRKAAHAASARQIRQLWRSKHSYCGAAG